MARLGVEPTAFAALDRLLDEALELPPAAREAWLGQLPAASAPLAPRLRALLSAAAGERGDLLGTLPKLSTAPTEPPTDAGRVAQVPGDVIGGYRLLGALGEGGMGTVWLAERADGVVRRQVALKVPRGAWRRGELTGRMARERDILAALDHPNVARLLDAGITAEGQPWLALELVEGRAIDRYVRDEALDARARLRLFLQVAAAVAHAHSRLVVHRDLKPSNVLVTAEGQVRLLDFGIAKLLEDGLAPETELTRVGGRALTPSYASPEQLEGGPVGVGADVYALGVLLYELLAEARPYRPARDSRAALEEAVLRAEPVRPSDAASSLPARRALRGDLDTVILKALKKRPEDRYPTVHALAEDLERWLQGRPVTAQPDRLAYRLRRLVGRHRAAAAAGMAVAVAILVGAGLAMAERARTEAARAFIASMRPDVDLEAAERAFHQAERQGRGPSDPRLMETRYTYGRALAEVGRMAPALAHLRRAERDAIARFGAESMLAGVVMTGRAAAQLQAGDLAEAVAGAAEVERLFGRITGAGSYPHAAALHRLGQARLAARDPAAALGDLDRAAVALRGLVGATHPRTLQVRAERALALALLGREEEADREVADVLERLPPAGEVTGVAQHVRGVVLRLAGDAAGAEALQRASLATLPRGPTGDDARMRILTEQGLAQLERGAGAEAEATLGEALGLFAQRQDRVTPARADALVGLGRARLTRGDAAAALGPLQAAEAFWRGHAPEGPWAGEAALWLGRCQAALGQAAAATTLARAGQLLARSTLPGDAALLAGARGARP